MVASVVAFAVLSLGVDEWGVRTHPAAAFYLLPPRAWELLWGASCASHPHLQGPVVGSPTSLGWLRLCDRFWSPALLHSELSGVYL